MSDDWHFSHKNESGHDVNAYGYDKNGVFRGTAPFKNNNDNQPIFKKKSKSKTAGIGGLIGLLLILFIISKILEFLSNNYVSVILILITSFLCFIFCLIIKKKKFAKARLATILAVIISLAIVIGIIFLGPVQNDGNFEKWGNNKTIFSESK